MDRTLLGSHTMSPTPNLNPEPLNSELLNPKPLNPWTRNPETVFPKRTSNLEKADSRVLKGSKAPI